MERFEDSFARQDQINQDNAGRVQLPVDEYIRLNLSRLQHRKALVDLIKHLEHGSCVSADKFAELGLVLEDMIAFAMNNNLLEEAIESNTLLARLSVAHERCLN